MAWPAFACRFASFFTWNSASERTFFYFYFIATLERQCATLARRQTTWPAKTKKKLRVDVVECYHNVAFRGVCIYIFFSFLRLLFLSFFFCVCYMNINACELAHASESKHATTSFAYFSYLLRSPYLAHCFSPKRKKKRRESQRNNIAQHNPLFFFFSKLDQKMFSKFCVDEAARFRMTPSTTLTRIRQAYLNKLTSATK